AGRRPARLRREGGPRRPRDERRGRGGGPRRPPGESPGVPAGPPPPPPYSSGTSIPSQPISQAFRQSSGSSPDSACSRPTMTSLGASRAMKPRALVLSISWLSVRARSIAIAPAPPARRRPGRSRCAGPCSRAARPRCRRGARPRCRCAAGARGIRPPIPMSHPSRHPPGRARRSGDGRGHPEAGELAVVGELRPLVGARPLAVDQPEVTQPEEPLDLAFDVDVGEHVAHLLMLNERHAVALGFLAVAEQPLPHSIAPDAPAGAVLQL